MTDVPRDLGKAETTMADRDATAQQIKAAADVFRRRMRQQQARALKAEADLQRLREGAATKARQLVNYLEQETST